MKIESRLRQAALIISVGLAIELLSLVPLHPLAFMGFVGLGVPFIALGIVLFLLALLNHSGEQ